MKKQFKDPRCPYCGIPSVEGETLPAVVNAGPKGGLTYQSNLVIKKGWNAKLTQLLTKKLHSDANSTFMTSNKNIIDRAHFPSTIRQITIALRQLGHEIKRGPAAFYSNRTGTHTKTGLYYYPKADRNFEKDLDYIIKMLSIFGTKKGLMLIRTGEVPEIIGTKEAPKKTDDQNYF